MSQFLNNIFICYQLAIIDRLDYKYCVVNLKLYLQINLQYNFFVA